MLPDPRQDERRDDGGDDPELHLREAEHRVGRGDRDVGARDEARTAAERVTVDTRDDRGAAGPDRLAHPVQPHRVVDVLLVREVDRAALPLDVRAGAEGRARAREDDRAGVADIRKGIRELADQLGVERVPPLRLRERDPKHVAVALDPEAGHPVSLEFVVC